MAKNYGLIKWEQYVKKRNNTYQERKKNNRDYNSFSVNCYIKKYGEEEGVKRWTEMRVKNVNNCTKQALIEKYGEEEAEIIAKRRWNNTSLESFISRLGEEEGKKQYSLYIEKMKNVYNLPFLIQTHGEEEGLKLYKKRTKNKVVATNKYSKISKKLFDKICDIMNIKNGEIAFYAEKEKFIVLSDEEIKILHQRILFPDFLYNNKIIEFYGNIWHANPNIYEDYDYPHPFKKDVTSIEIRNQDNNRLRVLQQKGYKVLVIWESEYKQDFNKVLKKCVNFLQDK